MFKWLTDLFSDGREARQAKHEAQLRLEEALRRAVVVDNLVAQQRSDYEENNFVLRLNMRLKRRDE